MKILNMRVGPATNSSSTHSIIINPSGYKYADTYDFDNLDYELGDNGYYVLADKQSKLNFFATTIFSAVLRHFDTPNDAQAFVNDLFGTNFNYSQFIDDGYEDEYIETPIYDASSVTPNLSKSDLMTDKHGRILFTKEFFNHIAFNDVYGIQKHRDDDYAYDSDDYINKFLDNVVETLSYGADSIFKKVDDYWLIYNRANGNKLRFTLDTTISEIDNANSPELADLCITKYCNKGCSFCYQSSTTKGKHSSFENITKWVDRLYDAGTVEIALGGGEPTQHPDFAKILEYIYKKGMIVNFSTYDDAWLKNEEIVNAVNDFVVGIGVSTHNINDHELYTNIKLHVRDDVFVMMQHALGTCDASATVDLFNLANKERIPLLLLGYKNVGFGKKFEETASEDIEVMLRLKSGDKQRFYTQIAIDTSIIQNYPLLVEMFRPREVFMTSEEGKFSMYVDATTNKFGPSSYCDPKSMVKGTECILDHFKTW